MTLPRIELKGKFTVPIFLIIFASTPPSSETSLRAAFCNSSSVALFFPDARRPGIVLPALSSQPLGNLHVPAGKRDFGKTAASVTSHRNRFFSFLKTTPPAENSRLIFRSGAFFPTLLRRFWYFLTFLFLFW